LRQLRAELPGIADDCALIAFAEQLAATQVSLDQFRAWVEATAGDDGMSSPADPEWSAYRAILALRYQGDLEEANWLAFLSIHIGPGPDDWNSVRTVYAGMGDGFLTWRRVTDDPGALGGWHARHRDQLARLRFSNHRKFESWKTFEDVVRSYVGGVRQETGGSQQDLFDGGTLSAADNFERLRSQLTFIYRFGRLAVYDFLCLLGELGLYALAPGHVYLEGATGPLNGARQLFGKSKESASILDERAVQLAKTIGVSVATMEDALCNWQKTHG
jgi:hypothetical protein